MGKTAACLKLIQILSARNDYVSANDLASILETNKRNIREYITELEILGYDFDSKRGIEGGYRLNHSNVLPQLRLTDDEKNALKDASSFLLNSSFTNSDLFNQALGKVLSSNGTCNNLSPLDVIEQYPLQMEKEELNRRYVELDDAIKGQLEVEVSYIGRSSVAKKYTIQPYKLFVYNYNWFILAYNKEFSTFGYYKLNRIESIYKTRNHFTLIPINENDYVDSFGMKKNGDFYFVKLEFKHMNTVIKERIYGKKQEVNEIDDETVILTCEMQNKEQIKSFVLSFGANCKVIEPSWLKEEISSEILKTLDLYVEE